MPQLAVIENDPDTKSLLCDVGRAAGFSCVSTGALSEAFELFESERIDVAVVDRVLDDGDGFELVEYLRDEFPHIRILLLSRKSEVPERVRGLEEGADDYMGKPFSVAELKLKLTLLLRRSKQLQGNSLQVGKVALFPDAGELMLGDTHQFIRRREAQILACLFRHKQQVVSRDQLITQVWSGAEPPTYSTVDVYVRRIRVLLGQYASVIKTIRGFGYMASER